ncbi:hypothetical protein [Clostridium fallax]|nr:hypothetical protein [Clostridium fallax]
MELECKGRITSYRNITIFRGKPLEVKEFLKENKIEKGIVLS